MSHTATYLRKRYMIGEFRAAAHCIKHIECGMHEANHVAEVTAQQFLTMAESPSQNFSRYNHDT